LIIWRTECGQDAVRQKAAGSLARWHLVWLPAARGSQLEEGL
jgi:hypothetical protein